MAVVVFLVSTGWISVCDGDVIRVLNWENIDLI